MQTRVRYLGHIVSSKGIETDPEKVRCVSDWPTPTDQRSLKQFMGLASYYRRFVQGFAQVAAPLNALTEKTKTWEWTAECNGAFLELKKRLVSAPILVMPCFYHKFILDTDASGEGLGAVLSQSVDGQERVVAYASKTLSKTERRYCATRRELLAVVWATQHFQPYLYGCGFLLRSDHSALQWLHSFKEPEGQVARWLERLAEYNYRVEHRPGRQHSNADSLSRLPCKQCGLAIVNESSCAVLTQDTSAGFIPVWTQEEIKNFQREDDNLLQVIRWVETDFPSSSPKLHSLQTLWAQRDYLLLQDEVLYRQWEDVPGGGAHKKLQLASLVPQVLAGLHDSPVGGHLGAKNTLDKVRTRFYWPNQRNDVQLWCASCAKCCSRKTPLVVRAPLQLDNSVSRPLQRVAMDILGPLPETARGNRYILVIGDYFTRWKEAYPMKDMNALTVAQIFVHEFIFHMGIPDVIHTDQGRNFESAVVKGICNLLGIKKTRTTPYHPQSDGMIERFNRTLLSMLSIAAEHDEHGWDLQLPLLMFAYRTSTHETTGATPFELMYGREAQLPEDLMFHIPATVDTSTSPGEYLSHLKTRLEAADKLVRAHANKQQMRQGENYNRTVKGKPFQVGDLVLLHCPHVPKRMSRKMHKPWKGPIKVKTVLGPVTYLIVNCEHPRKRLVVHNNRLKPFIGRESTDEGEMNQEISDRETTEQQQDNLTPRPEMTEEEEDWELPLQPNAPAEPEVHHQEPPVNLELPPELQQNIQPPGIPPAEELRRSGRIRRPPSRYEDPVSLPDCFECEVTLLI